MSLDFQHTTAHRVPNPFPRIVKGHGNLLLVRAKKNYNRTLKASLVQGKSHRKHRRFPTAATDRRNSNNQAPSTKSNPHCNRSRQSTNKAGDGKLQSKSENELGHEEVTPAGSATSKNGRQDNNISRNTREPPLPKSNRNYHSPWSCRYRGRLRVEDNERNRIGSDARKRVGINGEAHGACDSIRDEKVRIRKTAGECVRDSSQL